MATSSSDLKSGGKRKHKHSSVAARLSKAAKEAAADRARKQNKIISTNEPSDYFGNEEDEKLASITDLSNVIDQELLNPRDGYRSPLETSSMRLLLEHNDKTKVVKDPQRLPDCHHIALLFSKPLVQDQVSIEYASRLVSLGRAMKYDGYRPELICICGSSEPYGGSIVTDASAGVVFFRHLCAANDISLEGTDLRIIQQQEKYSSWTSSSLTPVLDEVLNSNYIETWMKDSEIFESNKDEYGFIRQAPRKKIHIHWTIISTDYHLCNLNDIHVRSPGQSPLNVLLQELDQGARSYRGIIKTTWCFRYSTYPYVYSKSGLAAFLGGCYLIAQELRPLLVNLRGVVKGAEFFQRDNYRALVATRRSLVTLLEEMNEAFRDNKQRETAMTSVPPNLKAQLQKTKVAPRAMTNKNGVGYNSTDVALESALLSLGRCMDLVRPAGILSVKSVTRSEWKTALEHLEDFLHLMQRACDPDGPLPTGDWGSLAMDNVTITSSEIYEYTDTS